MVGISLNSPHWHARVARRPGSSRRARNISREASISSGFPAVSVSMPCQLFPPSHLSGTFTSPESKHAPTSKTSEGNTQPTQCLTHHHRRKQARRRRPCIQTTAHACIIPSSRQHFPTATTAAPSNAKDHKRRLLGPSRPGEALYSVTVGGKSPLGRIMYVVSLFLFSWKSRCYASVVQCHGEDTATPGSSHAWRDGTVEKIRPP